MKTVLLLALITVSEATIGVFVKLTATFGWLIFSEVPGSRRIGGGALLLAAGFWLTREMNRGKEQAPVHPCHTQQGAYQCRGNQTGIIQHTLEPEGEQS